ncbi:hypothetical protein ACWF99_01085 [Nocardia sp. NPDC055002]
MSDTVRRRSADQRSESVTTYTEQWSELFGMTLDDWLCTGTVNEVHPDLSWDRVRRHAVAEMNKRLADSWSAGVDEAGTISSASLELFDEGHMKAIATEVRIATIDSVAWMSQLSVRRQADRSAGAR